MHRTAVYLAAMPVHTAIGRFTVAPVYAKPRVRSALRSQVLLGEPLRLHTRVGNFWEATYDDGRAEGFVAADQVIEVDPDLFREQTEQASFALDLFGMLLSDAYGMPVTFGARLPAYDGLQLRHDKRRFLYSGQAVLAGDVTQGADVLLRLGRKWLYVPELAGGRTPTGVGDAELVQLLLAVMGIDLPRALVAMSRGGQAVDFVEQCQAGDLAFFDDGKGALTHVGLLFPGSQVLHVSGRVRVDAVDHFGIFNVEERRYSHRLRIVKRYLPEAPATQAIELDDRYSEPDVDTQQILIF